VRAALRTILLAAALLGARSAAAGEEEGIGCHNFGVLFAEDAGQMRIYDGVRKGLELAQLRRVCLEDVKEDDASFAAFGRKIEATAAAAPAGAPPPLVFLIGPRAVSRGLAARLPAPTVCVDVGWTAARAPLVPLATPSAPGAVVRADLGGERLGQVLRELLGKERPRVRVAWATVPDAAAKGLAALAEAAGFDASPGAEEAWLHVHAGLGEALEPFPDLVKRARERHVPILSDDPARFGQGATVVLVPDFELVGRVAADAGRRLLAAGPVSVLPATRVATVEVWVDLDAADAQGVSIPLPFLASVDRLKRSARARGAAR
jgi:hypothetical protein